MAIECEHGHLARKCETCSANAEITRLTADVAKLREALNPWAMESKYWRSKRDDLKCRMTFVGDDGCEAEALCVGRDQITLGDLRRAARVMEETK